MDYNSNNKFKYLKKPVIILFTTILIFLFVIFFSLNKIKALNTSITENRKLENLLTQKADLLKNISDTISSGVTYADIALPSKNTALYGLNQIKNKAQVNGLSIENLVIAKQVTVSKGIDKTLISFDTTGDENNIYTFLESFSKILPLSKLEKFSITINLNNLTKTITLAFYSSVPLEKIPSVIGEINELTNNETQILNALQEYEIPAFSVPQANEFPVREDLFNVGVNQ